MKELMTAHDHKRLVCPACQEAEAENKRLRAFVAFVNLWAWRAGKFSDTERLGIIKFHPTAQAALKARETKAAIAALPEPPKP